LGIDNIIFISIVTNKLPEKKRPQTRTIGLALAFLIMIGFMLILDAFHEDVPKGYIYSAIVFSLTVELINIGEHEKRKRRLKNLKLNV